MYASEHLEGKQGMATEAEKMAAGAMTAALLQPAQSSGEPGSMEKTQSIAARRAAIVYHEILAAIQDAG
jgi:hypothetical protein